MPVGTGGGSGLDELGPPCSGCGRKLKRGVEDLNRRLQRRTSCVTAPHGARRSSGQRLWPGWPARDQRLVVLLSTALWMRSAPVISPDRLAAFSARFSFSDLPGFFFASLLWVSLLLLISFSGAPTAPLTMIGIPGIDWTAFDELDSRRACRRQQSRSIRRS